MGRYPDVLMKCGTINFANASGIGNQSRRLTYLLNPDRVLVIDSSGFSKNKEQHWDWYKDYKGYRVDGFPTNREIKVFLQDLTHVFVIENPLNYSLLDECKRRGIKLYIQSNWEFADHLNKDLTLPHKFLMPSHWKVEEMKQKFGDDKVEYLPPPIDPDEFKRAREINLARSGKRFLHVVGTLAANDRNGTLDLLEAVKVSKSDFELVIRSQHELPPEYSTDDKRVTFSIGNVEDPQSLYENFDALIIPRRYGGLCLSCNEGLMSGLPVIMPDISPNNQLLPKVWLVPARKKGSFITRTEIDVYETDVKLLADKLDWLTTIGNLHKEKAFQLGYTTFSNDILRQKYDLICHN
jgi:glycosyltransferase involved in cell wall biosynthesis